MCDKTILHFHTETQIANKYELRDAVVEAARKAAAAWRGNRVGLASMFAAVTDAVDALERAEEETND
jgi:hypothetical protein